jgi:hypothetical protein
VNCELKRVVALKEIIKDLKGDIVVEATILFPIMIMIFAALVLLAIYLPIQGTLQHATQYAATAIAAERSDTWLFFDESSMMYFFEDDKKNLENVYVALFRSVVPGGGDDCKAATIVKKVEESSITLKPGSLTVEYGFINYVIYQEVIVTATRIIPVPVDLSFIKFPREIAITVTSAAVVQNGDEFIRNLDIAVDFAQFISKKFGLDDTFKGIKPFVDKISSIMGW